MKVIGKPIVSWQACEAGGDLPVEGRAKRHEDRARVFCHDEPRLPGR